MHTMKIEITLTDELLGTASANPEVYEDFIGAKRPTEPDPEEIENLPTVKEELRKHTTVFHRAKGGKPMLYDYQIKGFFKDACGALSRSKDTEKGKPAYGSGALKAYKKVVDGLIFVAPREIPLILPEGASIGYCVRPLRAQTAQGERVALARSETVPAGTKLFFDVVLLDANLGGLVQEWLDYGKYRGLGQWRSSGKGAFSYIELNA